MSAPDAIRKQGRWIGTVTVLIALALFPFAFYTHFSAYRGAENFGKLLAESRPDLVLKQRSSLEGFLADNSHVLILPTALSLLLLAAGAGTFRSKIRPNAGALILLGILAGFAVYLMFFSPRITAAVFDKF